MKQLFNRTSLTFLIQFAVILSISFGVILVVGHYGSLAEEPSATKAAPVE